MARAEDWDYRVFVALDGYDRGLWSRAAAAAGCELARVLPACSDGDWLEVLAELDRIADEAEARAARKYPSLKTIAG